MSTAELDPISRACCLLREGAAELKNCHTLASTGHDWTGEPEAKAAYDEHMATADALERWADSIGAGGVESLRGRQCLHRISEPAGEYPALPEPDRVMEDWSIGGVLVDYFTTDQMRAFADATHALRASHGQAPASRKPKADSVDYVTEWAVTLWKGRERIRKELRASHGQAPAGLAVPSMSADEVNALPTAARAYIHQLATNTDPAGMVRENMQLRDTNAGLQSMYRKAADAAQEVVGCFHAAECEGLQAALAGTADEHLKDLVERRLMHALYAAQEVAGQAPAQAAPAAVAGPVAFTAEHVTYIRRYGGSCRDCADENGVCPNRGLPCADSEKAIRFVLEALAYGINHGYIAAPTTQPAPQQEAASVDLKTMELAESVGLIGPASRTNDLHAAIQRFHDLICANATIKAAQMAAEAISESAPQQGGVCDKAPAGWLCTRQHGHEGPCAAEPTLSARSDEWVEGYAAGVRDGWKDALRTQQAAPTPTADSKPAPGVDSPLARRFGGCPSCGRSDCVAMSCTRADPADLLHIAARAPADSVLEDAARESEYRRGYRHGYEQRDAEVRGALA